MEFTSVPLLSIYYLKLYNMLHITTKNQGSNHQEDFFSIDTFLITILKNIIIF